MKNNLGNNLREGLYKNNQTKPKPDIDRNMVLDPPAAKWQQEQDKNKFSEIEVLDLLVGILDANKCFVTFIDIKEWFEQNKKK